MSTAGYWFQRTVGVKGTTAVRIEAREETDFGRIFVPQLCISQIEASTSPPWAYPGHLTSFPAREEGI